MNTYNRPDFAYNSSSIDIGGIIPNNFELKPSFIQFIASSQYRGTPTECARSHLVQFLEKCSTLKINRVSHEKIMMLLFPFSLAERSRAWLDSHPPRTFITWNGLSEAFINKYYPPSKTAKKSQEILEFKMLP